MPTEISEYPKQPVTRPVMFQGWTGLTFLHWPYEPDLIARLLPADVELDTFDGAAWVGLTPFLLTRLHPPFLPSFPWISCFPEMNVRTYVRASDGERGIWFFSLEAARVLAVAGARLMYGLPYRWAAMRVRFGSKQVEYASRRHIGAGKAHIVIRRESPIQPTDRERFLTARFRLYTKIRGRLAFAQVEHQPWPLESASIAEVEQDVIQNSNVPAPAGQPLVHFSPGIYVRVGRPMFAS
jgi:uncharacterized protein